MSWYSTVRLLLKVAGPQDKIRKFNIQNPAMRLLILLNENSIRWNGYSYETTNAEGETEEVQVGAIRVKEADEDINNYLKFSAIPALFSKANPKSKDNNYIKSADIDAMYHNAKENNIFDLDLQKAFAMNENEKNVIQNMTEALSKGTDPAEIIANNKITQEEFENYKNHIARKTLADGIKAGKSIDEMAAASGITTEEATNQLAMFKKTRTAGERFYLGVINRQKKERFEDWTKFYEAHPEISNNPSFAYLLIKQMFDSSDAKTLKPPPLADVNAAIAILNKINNIRLGNPKEEELLKNVNKALPDLKINKGVSLREAFQDATAIEALDVFQKAEGETRFKNKYGFSLSDFVAYRAKFAETMQSMNLTEDQIFTLIEQQKLRNFKLKEEYDAELTSQYMKRTEKTFDGNDGWLKLPRKDRTQPRTNPDGTVTSADAVFEENLEKLEQLSIPNGWCTTRNSNGTKYLTAGDFWLYIKNGQARVGIRFGGSNFDHRNWNNNPIGDDILEIAGDQTGRAGRSCPVEYWKEIVHIIHAEGLENRITSFAVPHWEQILKQKALNQSFFNEDGSINGEEISEFRKMIISDPSLYTRIDEEQFRQNPEVLEYLQKACKEGWFNKIQKFRVDDAVRLANDVAANAQDMPDFVLKDPAFQEIVHKSLSAAYQNEPINAGDILTKVPNHWEFYPQGKEIFKQAVLKKYNEGLFWKANVYGYTKKTLQEKREIDSAKIDFDKIQDVIAKYASDINLDPAFEAAVNQAKAASVAAIMQRGFISVDMPIEMVNAYFEDPNRIEELSEKYSDKISNGHKDSYSRQTPESVVTDKYMDRELNAVIPPFARKTQGAQQLIMLTKKKVLKKSIERFKAFEQHYKEDPELYEEYKKHIFERNPLGVKLRRGEDFFDKKLIEDPDYKQQIGNYQGNIEAVIKTISVKPSQYLTLPPEVQQDERVKDAYLKSRVFGPQLTTMKLPKEFIDPRFPAFLKQEQNVVNKYIELVIHLLKTGRPRTEYFLDCSEIDPVAFENQTIIDLCQARKTPINKNIQPQAPNAQAPQIPQQPIQQPMNKAEQPNPNVQARILEKNWYYKAAFCR